MAASIWWDDDPTAGEWTTVTRSGRSTHSGPAGRYPNTTPALSTAAEVAKVFAGLEIEDGNRRLDKYDIPVEVSGEGVPAPADEFEESGLVEAVLRNVARCGYDSLTPVQRYSIPIVLSGRDLMACAQTGSGKTAAFCLPIVSGLVAAAAGGLGGGGEAYHGYNHFARPRALVLAPTKELAAQIHEEAKNFSYQTGIRVQVAYGGIPMFQQLRDIERGVDILVATPGRLVDMIERSKVSLEAIKYLVMDEADRMLDMGFEPQIRKIVDGMGMPRKSVRQTMLFSATFPPQIQRLASDFLSKYIFITVGRVGSSTDLITHKVKLLSDYDKRIYLLDLLEKQSFYSSDGKPLTLVFLSTNRDADSLRSWLYKKGFSATAIHGDRTQEERKFALRNFKSGLTPIMVATDVVSRGLDFPNVRHVISYDLPESIEDYVHRIGRIGREGNAGCATAFFTEQNHPIAKGLLELMTESKQNVPGWLWDYARRPVVKTEYMDEAPRTDIMDRARDKQHTHPIPRTFHQLVEGMDVCTLDDDMHKKIVGALLVKDPKRDLIVPSRFCSFHLDGFDLDEKSTAPLGPRYQPAECVAENAHHNLATYSTDVVSIRVIKAGPDYKYPVEVYGKVIARDEIDHKCVYLFDRERKDAQTINSEKDMLSLTGPYRALVTFGYMYFEFDLKIKGKGDPDDEVQFSKGVISYFCKADRKRIILQLPSFQSTVKLVLQHVDLPVAASLEMSVVKQGPSDQLVPFDGKITAGTSRNYRHHTLLYDSSVRGRGLVRSDGSLMLDRSLVAVNGYVQDPALEEDEKLVLYVCFLDAGCEIEDEDWAEPEPEDEDEDEDDVDVYVEDEDDELEAEEDPKNVVTLKYPMRETVWDHGPCKLRVKVDWTAVLYRPEGSTDSFHRYSCLPKRYSPDYQCGIFS